MYVLSCYSCCYMDRRKSEAINYWRTLVPFTLSLLGTLKVDVFSATALAVCASIILCFFSINVEHLAGCETSFEYLELCLNCPPSIFIWNCFVPSFNSTPMHYCIWNLNVDEYIQYWQISTKFVLSSKPLISGKGCSWPNTSPQLLVIGRPSVWKLRRVQILLLCSVGYKNVP